MVFAPVDPSIKEKIIESYLAGKGRNQIDRELREQKIKVSHGSISNIINAYKRQHERSLQKESSCIDTVNTSQSLQGAQPTIDMKNTDSPVSASGRPGVGLAATNIVIPRDGGPLSHILNEDAATSAVEVNPDSICKDTTTVATKPSRDLLINDQDVNRKIETVKEEKVEQHQSRPSLSNSSDPKPPITSDPDSDDNWDRKFLKRVMDQRAQNIHELQLIENGKRELEEERQQIGLMKQSIVQQINDLKAREAKVAEVENLIPLSRQLLAMKVDVTTFIPWAEMVQEYAITHNKDLTTAAFDIVRKLGAWKNLETIYNVIRNAEERLSSLGNTIRQNEAAITMLVKLKAMGYSKRDIKELVALVQMWSQGNGISYRKLDTELIDVGTRGNNGNLLRQPGSDNPGSSPPLVNDNGFSKNNLIRLNLLRNATTNMLNRMGTKN